MPRTLRWIAAATAGIVAQFAYFAATLPLAGDGGAADAGEAVIRVGPGIGLLLTLGAALVPMIAALAVNDWLAATYPRRPKRELPLPSNEPRR